MDETNDSLRRLPIFRILGGVIVVLVIAGLGYFFLRSRASNWSANANSSGSANASTDKTFDARQGIAPADADKDGLTDAEEAQLGTNPTVADTDKDGLNDFDEVKVYHSDPKNADTDKDGNADGVEVSKGFSPTGSGKLFDTSSSATTNATP